MCLFRCRGCREKDSQIGMLKEQIDWLRAQVGTPTWATQAPLKPEDPVSIEDMGVNVGANRAHLSEEEAEIIWLRDNEYLSATQAEEALAKLKNENIELD